MMKYSLIYALIDVFLIFLISIMVKCIWNRRWLYYYSFQFDGPFAWPVFGNAHLLRGGFQELYKKMMHFGRTQPPIFRFWLGSALVIITSRPADLEILLNRCLEKADYYNFGKEILSEGLLVAPVSKWKVNRRLINPTFSSKVLNPFVDIFNDSAKKLVKTFDNSCNDNCFDLLPLMFRCTLDIAIETLGDLDATLIKGQDKFIQNLIRLEEIMVRRVFNIFLHPDWIYKHTSLAKEYYRLSAENIKFIEDLIAKKKSNILQKGNNFNKKRFLNHLFSVNNDNCITEKDICAETQTMLVTASESTAVTISMVLLILSVRPDILDKIHNEFDSIFIDNDQDPTLEDMNKMNYLECVVNETMRMLPTIPVIARQIEENVKIESYVVPAGSYLIVPISLLNAREEFWEDPHVFNPDRFLQQEVKNRHKCTFIPFSYGVRNCIGLKYGMMSVKLILATILRHYKFHAVDYKSVDDIEPIYNIILKPKKGFKVKIEKLNRCNYKKKM